MGFTDTLKTWVDDRPLAKEGERMMSVAEKLIADHQPPAESPVREFADHMDRERQSFKDWVRREIGLLVKGKSHDERAKENP